MAVQRTARQSAAGQLHHEGGVSRIGRVLPPGDASGKPSEVSNRQADHARVGPLDPRVAARRVDEPGMLVIPDADRRPKSPHDAQDHPRLRLRERARAGVVRPSRAVQPPPSPWRVAVEVHAVCVLAGSGGATIGVERIDQQERSAGWWPDPPKATRDRLAGALVAVQAADYEYRASAPQTDAPSANCPAVDRAAEHKSPRVIPTMGRARSSDGRS